MLKMKHNNISMQLITLVVLCVCCSLLMSLWLTPTHAAQPPQQPYYVVNAYQTPGVVYRIVNRKPEPFFGRRAGTITSIAFCNGQLYFCSTNDKKIYQKIEEQERVVFEHRTFIRDVAVDPNGNLHFSEASGANGDGKIYKLSPRVDEIRPKQRYSISNEEKPIQVRLSTVDEFWAGDFTFDAWDNLYLSNGNLTPAFIYRLEKMKGSQYGSPRKIYKDTQGAIKGIAVDPSNSDFIYYADWKHTIHKLNLRYLGRTLEFSRNIVKSDNPHISDVAFDVKIRRKK